MKKSSTEVGTEFEKQVAELYIAVGATVQPNISICNKKVDLFVELPIAGQHGKHRLLVECKNEKHNRNQISRVAEFSAYLEQARRNGQADAAEIVSRQPWSDQAKGFAHQTQGLSLRTYDEKLRELIDFRPYLQRLVDANQGPGDKLKNYYVDGKGLLEDSDQEQEVSSLATYSNEWMAKPFPYYRLAILGEFGSGKSSFAKIFASDLAKNFLENPVGNTIPILIELRQYAKAFKIENLIVGFLDEQCEVVNPRYSLFRKMMEAGLFTIILDGLDEMAVTSNEDTAELNLNEIEKIASVTKTRLIITSRPEYFMSEAEERRSLNPAKQLFSTRSTVYEVLRLHSWDEAQVCTFLKKRVPLLGTDKDWHFYWEKIRAEPSLHDLSTRPVLAEMIAKTLPRLIGKKEINRANLYDTYLDQELRRQRIEKRRDLLVCDDQRLQLLQQLAALFFDWTDVEITYEEALDFVSGNLALDPAEAIQYTRDFLSSSFLIRRSDIFTFSHRSFYEHLIAKTLDAEIASDTPELFGKRPLERQILSFVAEYSPSRPRLRNWVELGKQKNIQVASNALSLLVKLDPYSLLGERLSEHQFYDVVLDSANLSETVFIGCIFRNVSLVGANFKDTTFAQSDVSNVAFDLMLKVKRKKGPKATHGELLSAIKRLVDIESISVFGESPQSRTLRLICKAENMGVVSKLYENLNGKERSKFGIDAVALYEQERNDRSLFN